MTEEGQADRGSAAAAGNVAALAAHRPATQQLQLGCCLELSRR
jgi:hypothetical protein